jgi:catechol 2,3-dioxygenase-like lactoylglutathione lyase family enzyme
VLLGIQHFALVVSDLERSRRFYGEAAGMEELQRPPNFTFRGAWFRAGGQELHLLLAEDTTSEPGWKEPGKSALTGLAAHVALEVDDLDEARARLAAHGVEVFTGPFQRGDGIVQFYVLDPDGHMVEWFTRTGEDQSGAAERAPVRG